LVDIADDAAALGTLDVDFLQHTVFHHRHPRLHGGDVHQDLFAHCCSRPMALYGTAEADGWLDSNGLSARATGSGEPDERDDSSVSVFFHPAGDSRLVEQLRRLAQRQTDHGRIAAAQLGDEHRAPTLDCIATGLVTRLATGPVGL